MLTRLERWIDRFTDVIGGIATVAMGLMLINVFCDAVMRYFFNTGSIALQELEWHFFSVAFMFAIGYALKDDSHVRVDILYDRLSPRAQALINIAGTLVLLIPLSVLIIHGSVWFVHESWQVGEISGDPGGLTHRWLIKAVIPLAFVFLIVSSIGFMIRNLNIYRGIEPPRPHGHEDDVL